MKLIVTDRKGEVHTLDGRDDWSAMEVIRDANLPMSAECGGACACATCHVYVDPAWQAQTGEAGGMEQSMLDFANEVEANSRLSCQIRLTPEMEGLRVKIAPED